MPVLEEVCWCYKSIGVLAVLPQGLGPAVLSGPGLPHQPCGVTG